MKLSILIVVAALAAPAVVVGLSNATPLIGTPTAPPSLTDCQQSAIPPSFNSSLDLRATASPPWADPQAAPLGAVPAYFLLARETNWTVAGQSCYRFTVTVAAPNLTVGDTGFELKTELCGPISQTFGIQYLDPALQPLASEDVQTHSWGALAGVGVSVGDFVLIDSIGSLPGTQLVSEVSYEGGNDQSAMPVSPYSGESEGCGF
ncbi:MAG: hypothetical protein L3K17_01815 [Thermoplasmata archaeon]|nr:hypothetical protein [Thermoplasmata archaeon]